MENDISITLAIRTENHKVERDVPKLIDMLPSADYVIQTPPCWMVGPKTFETLMDEILRPSVKDETCLFLFKKKMRDGMWDMLYRGVPVQPSRDAIEGRLWPA